MRVFVQVLSSGKMKKFSAVTGDDGSRRFWVVSWGDGQPVKGTYHLHEWRADAWLLNNIQFYQGDKDEAWALSGVPFTVLAPLRVLDDTDDSWLRLVADRVEEKHRWLLRKILESYGAV